MAVVVLGLTWLGGLPFRILAAAIAGAVFFEWCAMARTAANAAYQWLIAAFLAAVLVALVAGYPAPVVLGVFALAFVASIAAGLIRGQGTWTSVGLAYAGLSALSIAFLRDDDRSGLFAILFLFAVVWATDILAYFVGKAVGGPKLAPSISPGKTWSGAAGGTIGGMIAGYAAASATGSAVLPLMVGIAFFLSVVSQIGDLFESWVKRRHGVKDSGNLIPGHGGVMDRVDGLVVAAFALYVICVILGGMDRPAQGLFPA